VPQPSSMAVLATRSACSVEDLLESVIGDGCREFFVRLHLERETKKIFISPEWP
jgi:hypothetical protein